MRKYYKPHPLDYRVKPTPYTPEEEAYIRDNYLTMTDAEIAEHLGKTETAIKSHRGQMCLVRRFRWTEEMDNLLRRWYKVKSNSELAEMIGCEQRQVAARKHALKLTVKRMTTL